MSRLFIIFAYTAFLAAAEPSFPHLASDLPVDPAVRWGVLDNGLRWAVLANQQPPGKVSLRLQVQVGSLAERDEERGLAHVLEHMAFLGTAHYPPGQLNTVLQPLGIGFGSHSNAHTSFDETVYKLDLPNAEPAMLDLGLQVLADYAGGMLLDPAQLERERGVILAEMRDRDSADLRIHRARFAAAYAGTQLAERFPIGVPETVQGATAARLRGFYDAGYRPEAMILTVVGDVDPDAVQAQIPAFFAGLTDRSPARPAVDQAGLVPAPLVGLVFREAEATVERVSISVAKYAPRGIEQRADRAEEIAIQVAHACLEQRLEALIAKNPSGPVVDLRCGSWRWLHMREALCDVQVRDHRQSEALRWLATEWHRFHAYGPTAAELTLAKVRWQARLEAAVAQAERRESRQLAADIYEHVSEGAIFMAPRDELIIEGALVAELDATTVHAAFVQTWQPGRRLIAVTGPQVQGAASDVVAEWQAVLAQPVDAPTTVADIPFAYADRPEPGAVVARESLRHGIESLTFANGARAAIQTSRRKPGEVRIRWRFAIPAETQDPAVHEWAKRAFISGGLAAHPFDQLQRLLASHVLSWSCQVTDGGFLIDAIAVPADVEIAFQVLHAYVTDPGWDADGIARTHDRWRQELAALPGQLDAQVSRRFQFLATSGTPGRRPATPEEALASSVESLRAWLVPILREAPLTVTVVGDVETETAVTLASAYVGSLPVRSEGRMVLSAAELATVPAAPIPRVREELVVPGPVPRATVMVAWPTDDVHSVAVLRRSRLLADALQERVRERLRERLGQAYSPQVWHEASEVWNGFGYLAVVASVAPNQVAGCEEAIRAVVTDVAENGIDAPLLAQVQPPLLNALDAIRSGNGYWLSSVVDRVGWQPFRLDWADSMQTDIAGITAADLTRLAKDYLRGEPLVVIGVSPGAPAGDHGHSEPAR